jgi:acetyl esterase
MPLDPHAKRLLRLLAASAGRSKPSSAKERRLAFDQLMQTAAMDAGAAKSGLVVDASLPGPGGSLLIRVYTPHAAAGRVSPALVYFHGGGWIAGGLDTHMELCIRLAEASGCRTAIVDYRRAPEHKFPAALEDGIAAVEWLWANAQRFDIDAGRLAIGGDSAGAAIAVGVCQSLKDTGGPRLALQLLLCPILDAVGDSQSLRDFAEGYFLDAATLADDLKHYCPQGADPSDPRLSPLRATRFGGLPPAHIHTAEFDPVRDEGCAYADRLLEAGVSATYRCHKGMIHLFYAMPRFIPGVEIIVRDLGIAFGRDIQALAPA